MLSQRGTGFLSVVRHESVDSWRWQFALVLFGDEIQLLIRGIWASNSRTTAIRPRNAGLSRTGSMSESVSTTSNPNPPQSAAAKSGMTLSRSLATCRDVRANTLAA